MIQYTRNILILLLTLTYSMSVSGFSIKAHYCHGKLVSVKFNASDFKCCCGKKKMPPKCCDTKKVEVKIKDTHLKTDDKSYSEKNSSEPASAFAVQQQSSPLIQSYLSKPNAAFFSKIPLPDIYLFIRVFRI